MKAYIYALQGPPESLQPLAQTLGAPLYHWVANAARLVMGQGFPDKWKDQGAVFGPKGELRWWKAERDYRALLLTDTPVDGISPLPGEWTARDEDVFLQNLNDRRSKPNFSSYPHGGTAGRLRGRVYYCDGMATFISPRELLKDKE